MGSDRKAFNEVKALLGKLDRSIDEARSKRLGPDEPEPTPPSNGTDDPTSTTIGEGAPSVPPRAKPARPASKYGRAKPLNNAAKPTNTATEGDSPTGKWQTRPKGDDDRLIG